jgi:pyruvate/2-oxoglutarate dehydrogenase complex dihydrolipoamide acyltransferase (E2) component
LTLKYHRRLAAYIAEQLCNENDVVQVGSVIAVIDTMRSAPREEEPLKLYRNTLLLKEETQPAEESLPMKYPRFQPIAANRNSGHPNLFNNCQQYANTGRAFTRRW